MPANPTTPVQVKLPEESCFSPQGVAGGQDSFAESAKVSPDQIAEAREKLLEIEAVTARKQLPITSQVNELAIEGLTALAALNALPVEDMQVTDEMVERATNAMAEELRSNYVTVSGDLTSCVIDGGRLDLRDIARAALAASIGCGKD